MQPRPIEALADGSHLVELRPSGDAGRKSEPLVTRIVEYTIDDGRHNEETYRLFATILDPTDVSAEDLACASAQHSEIESVFDELKTHQRRPRTVSRSKYPEVVLQEIWGHLCCHYAIRTLSWEVAVQSESGQAQVREVARQSDPSPAMAAANGAAIVQRPWFHESPTERYWG